MMIILREVKQGVPSHLLMQLMVLHQLQLVRVMFHILLQGNQPPHHLRLLLQCLDNSAIVPVDQPVSPTGPPLPVSLPASTGQGLQISAQLTRQDGQIFYSILFENGSQFLLDGFMIQFNKNTFGLAEHIWSCSFWTLAGSTIATGDIGWDSSAHCYIPEYVSRSPKFTFGVCCEKQSTARVLTSLIKFYCMCFSLRRGKWSGASLRHGGKFLIQMRFPRTFWHCGEHY